MQKRRLSASQLKLSINNEIMVVKAPFIIIDSETGVIESIESMIGNKCEPGSTEYLEGRLQIGEIEEGKEYSQKVVSRIEGPIVGDLLQIRHQKEIKIK